MGTAETESYCASCSRSFSPEVTVCPHDGARLVRFEAKRDALIGVVLDGRYEIRAQLGEGGMGAVYRGWQLSVDREVAIKVVHPSIANEREAAKRFLREARLASRLNAPGIVNVYDFGQSAGGVLYLVMELLRGTSLTDVLAGVGSMPPRRVIHIALQLCDALDVAHAQGIVHRDLKPGNIVILDDPPGRDVVKVLDFGLAKTILGEVSAITNTHAMLGTPLYMAPEQIEGAAVDNRTDLYALGCILFELIAGSPPYGDTTLQGIFARHLTQPVPALGPRAPAPLADAISRLLAKDANARFSSCAELRAALLRAQLLLGTPPAGMPIVATPAPPVPPVPVARQRRLGIVIGAALATLAIAAVVLVTADRTPTAEAPPQPAAAPPPPPVDAAIAPPIDASHPVIDAAPAEPPPPPEQKTAKKRGKKPPKPPPPPDARPDDLPFIK